MAEETFDGKRLRKAVKEAMEQVDRYITDEQYVLAANAQIAERIKYGVRIVDKPQFVARRFAWSNGFATWSPFQWVIDPAKAEDWMLRLDANEILLPAISLKRTGQLVKLFDPLPLFANSFEYVHQQKRSEKPIKATEIDWAPNQIVAPDDGINRR